MAKVYSIHLITLVLSILVTSPVFAKFGDLNMDWDPVEGATKYQVKIECRVGCKDSKPIIVTTKDSKVSKNLGLGKYEIFLRSFDSRGVPGQWSDPSPFSVLESEIQNLKAEFEVTQKNTKVVPVKISWLAPENNPKLVLKIRDLSTNKSKTVTTNKSSFTLRLAVARSYTWSLTTTTDSSLLKGKPSFSNKIDIIGPKLTTPTVKKQKDDFIDKVFWKKVRYAQSYEINIQNKTLGQDVFSDFKKESQKRNSFKIDDSYPPGVYQLTIISKANMREDSEAYKGTFTLGDRQKKISYANLSAVYEKTRARNTQISTGFQLSSMNYSSSIKEDGTVVSFDSKGGTVSGKIAIDFLDGVGLVAYSEIGAIVINDDSRSFFQNEASFVYVLKPRFGLKLRVGGGGFYKELPYIEKIATSTDVDKDVVRYMGPLVYGDATQQFAGPYVLKAFSQVYWPLIGLITPNEEELEWTASYKGGILAGYDHSVALSIELGYIYQIDRVHYLSSTKDAGNLAADGDVNEISFSQHHSALILSYKF